MKECPRRIVIELLGTKENVKEFVVFMKSDLGKNKVLRKLMFCLLFFR